MIYAMQIEYTQTGQQFYHLLDQKYNSFENMKTYTQVISTYMYDNKSYYFTGYH